MSSLKIKILKNRHRFADERALIRITISSCHWKTLVPFCLQKKRPENTFLTLIVNYCKIIQKNKLRHSKKQSIGYLIICNVIYSLLILIEKLPFFNKHLHRFIISLMLQNIRYLDNVTV